MVVPPGSTEGGPPPPGAQGEGLPGPLTTVKLDAAGAYSVLVPKGEDPIMVELLVDLDGNGMPSLGDRMASSENGVRTDLIPSEDRTEIDLDGTDREWSAPSGGPGTGEPGKAGPPPTGPGSASGKAEGAKAEGGKAEGGKASKAEGGKAGKASSGAATPE